MNVVAYSSHAITILMATRTYLIFTENNKEVLNTQIFGNNFYGNTFFNEVVKLAGMTRFPECGCMEVPFEEVFKLMEDVIVRDGETYHKHMIFLNDDTTYVVEDIGGADVSRSAYEIHFLPEVLESGMLDLKIDK